MGCWNKTCGLTGLYITAGTPVYVFVIEQNTYHDRCYSTAFWKPVMLPFLSVYNNYGGGRNNHKNINYIIDGIKKDIVEMPLGENPCHDIEVTADKMNEEFFFEAVHEGRLKVGGRYGATETDVDFVMMRKDVVDNICETWQKEMYVGQGKGTSGYYKSYVFYKFSDIVAAVPEFLDKLSKELEDDSENPLPPTLRLKYAMRGLSELYDYNEHNLVSTYLRNSDDHRFSRIVRPTDIVVTLMTEGKREEAQELLIDILRASFIDTFMDETRKVWMPGGHEGSQNDDQAPYRVLCNVITTALDADKAEWDEDFGEDE